MLFANKVRTNQFIADRCTKVGAPPAQTRGHWLLKAGCVAPLSRHAYHLCAQSASCCALMESR